MKIIYSLTLRTSKTQELQCEIVQNFLDENTLSRSNLDQQTVCKIGH